MDSSTFYDKPTRRKLDILGQVFGRWLALMVIGRRLWSLVIGRFHTVTGDVLSLKQIFGRVMFNDVS